MIPRAGWAAAVVGAVATACGDGDPCAEVAGTCLAIEVRSAADPAIAEIDQLELDVLFGDRHGTTTTQLAGGGAVALPVVTAVAITLAGTTPVHVGVVAAGKLGGTTLGTGAAAAMITTGDRATVEVVLGPVTACVAGGFYCGGDKVAGDPDTLYQCNGGGVPLARGRCAAGCVVTPTTDDGCRGAGGPCVDGGFYCGGDKLDGDPQTLYRCSGGVGVAPMTCAAGCVVAPPGTDDYCR